MSKNWVKLQIEPVEVPIENDEPLLFSTVQSVVPGAHGLYFRENGQRKALGFDTTTGRVFAPGAGWNAQNIYVHLAHGSRHGAHYADYSKASQQFEKNISAVQKLIAAAGLGYGPKSISHKAGRSRSKVKSGFEAQPENVHISDESDSHVVSQSNTVESGEIKKILEVNEELKLQLKEVKWNLSEREKKLQQMKSGEIEIGSATKTENEELQNLRKRNSELESLFSSKKNEVSAGELKSEEENKLEMLQAIQDEQAELIRSKDNHIHDLCTQLEEAKTKIQDLTEKEEEINNLHTVIEDLRTKLSASQKDRNECSSSLGEHKELLKNAKDKISYLENQVNLRSAVELAVDRNIPLCSSPKPRSRNTSESLDDNKAQIRSLETKLQVANNALRTCELEKQKLQEANWYANERIAKVEKENGYVKGLNEEMRIRLRDSSNSQLLAERDQRIVELAEQRSKLEWRLGELQQWWNDAKWKVGELEAGVAHQRFLLDTASNKIQSLNDQLVIALRTSPQAPSTSFNPTYAVRQNYSGQWQLANNNMMPPPCFMPQMSSPSPYQIPQMPSFNMICDTKRILVEIENPEQKEVFVLGSFLNWQCALRADIQRDGRSGVVVDVPRGRHEFRFLLDGKWITSSSYATVPNGFGGNNNLLMVE